MKRYIRSSENGNRTLTKNDILNCLESIEDQMGYDLVVEGNNLYMATPEHDLYFSITFSDILDKARKQNLDPNDEYLWEDIFDIICSNGSTSRTHTAFKTPTMDW